MMNFYRLYNGIGLDKEEYSSLIIGYNDLPYLIESPLTEHIIKRSPRHAYYYAHEIKQTRWLEAEPYIMVDAYSSYWYARDIIKGRWIEAEPYIIKDSCSAYWYSIDIMGGRWLEAEGKIKENDYWWTYYSKRYDI